MEGIALWGGAGSLDGVSLGLPLGIAEGAEDGISLGANVKQEPHVALHV